MIRELICAAAMTAGVSTTLASRTHRIAQLGGLILLMGALFAEAGL